MEDIILTPGQLNQLSAGHPTQNTGKLIRQKLENKKAREAKLVMQYL